MTLGIKPLTPAFEGNYINHSRLYQYELPIIKAQDISINYVYQGQEAYEVNNFIYQVTSGNYLLVNNGSEYSAILNGKQLNEGLCVHLTNDLIKKSYYAICKSDEHLLSYPDETWNADIEMVENIYEDSNSDVSRILHQLAQRAAGEQDINDFSEEHYFQLAVYLVRGQMKLIRKIRNIKAKTPAVQKELFKKVQTAKRHIDENLSASLTIAQLAPVAQMSPFHFIRTFKEVYKKAPYQYIIQARLEQAAELLKKQPRTVTEVAHLSGFCDLYSFSKSFKKRYGVSPVKMLQLK